MTDRTQFEAMLEALINEDQETAKEIFHNIVVAKSREIYEELLESDFSESTPDGVKPEEEEDMEEAFGDDEGGDEPAADDDGENDGEDGEGDFGDDDMGGEEEGEDLSSDEQTDRILDLEDALEELKAEFEQLMAGEENEPEHADMFGGDEIGADDMGGDLESELDELGQPVFEYVNKVSLPKHGDNGVNAKSIVAKKNDMGGTTANIAKGGTSETGGTKGGLLNPATKEDNAGNINKPGANAGKTAFKKREPGHGAEKKGAAPQEDKSAGSPLNGAPGRAK